MARPVTIVASGAPAYVNVGLSGPPATPVTDGPPIVLASSGAPPIGLVNDDGSVWSNSVNAPSGFTWTPPYTISRIGAGSASTFTTNYDYEATKDAVNGTIYVDSLLGSNANPGTSQGSPVRSLSQAITNANALAVAVVRILVRTDGGRRYHSINSAGTTLNDHLNDVVQTCNLIIDPDTTYADTPIYSLNGPPGNRYTWTQFGATGCYNPSSFLSARPFIDLGYLDATGRPTGLFRVASVASLVDPTPELLAAASAYGRGACFFDATNSVTWVRMPDGRAPDADLIPCSATTAHWQVSAAASRKLWMRRLYIIGGTRTLAIVGSGSTVNHTVHAQDCAFLGAHSDPGGIAHKSGGASLLVFQRCAASYNGLDGFNYHGAATSAATCPTALEIDCVAIGNGDAGGGANNGSTAHEFSRAICVGGTYGGARDRVIHDINSAQRWMMGSTINAPIDTSSASGLLRSGNGAAEATKHWLDAVRFGAVSGSQFHIDALAAAQVKYANMDPAGWVLPGAGSIATYTP